MAATAYFATAVNYGRKTFTTLATGPRVGTALLGAAWHQCKEHFFRFFSGATTLSMMAFSRMTFNFNLRMEKISLSPFLGAATLSII